MPTLPTLWTPSPGHRSPFSAESTSSQKIFYLRLTKLGPGGNPLLRSVCLMTAQLTPASGRDDSGFPRPRTGRSHPETSDVISGVHTQPGESDPARMLSGVLLLVIVTVVMTLALVWWLA